MAKKVVIVGGGIIGIASAWYLSESDFEITVIDKGTIGGACSAGNCGLVCPSHVLPLTEPGAFKAAAKALVSPGSPFRIKPQISPSFWSWMWQFSRRCNERSMIQAAHGIQAMLTSAMQEYEKLVEQDGIECEWQKKGLLFTYLNSSELDSYSETNKLLTELFNEPARKLSAKETIDLEPAIRDGVAGSWYYEHDAHLRPDILVSSLRQRLEERGVEFLEHCAFERVKSSNAKAKAIVTPSGELSADEIVFASGAWTPLLATELGVKVPILPGKGYSITMPRPSVCPAIPIIFPEHRVAVTPMQTGYRLGSIMEFAGYDETIKPERLKLLREGAQHYLREPYCEPELETWFGWRPMTYDSLPVIDRSPKWSNVWIAAGHNMLGLSMAPATGKLISELVTDAKPHIATEPYALSRF